MNLSSSGTGGGMQSRAVPQRRRIATLLLAALAGGWSAGAVAQLDAVVEQGQAKVAEGQKSQERIDSVVNAQQAKLIEYRALLKQIEGLQQYNEQLSTQVAGQLALIDQFDSSVEQVAQIERQMLPLIIRMSDALTDFVEIDLPFHETERAERLEYIKRTTSRADVSVAEKFRQIIEAYQVEIDYGRTIDAYQQIVQLDGGETEVDVLRFGRIVMAAQTKDANRTAVWNPKSNAWEPLSAGDYRNSIRHGIRMAKKQASIELITLPIAAPESAQ